MLWNVQHTSLNGLSKMVSMAEKLSLIINSAAAFV